jgi:hypothetical protein
MLSSSVDGKTADSAVAETRIASQKIRRGSPDVVSLRVIDVERFHIFQQLFEGRAHIHKV